MLRSRTCLGGMVSAPHHLAAQAGVEILREGGNAVEAMVAAAAAIAVVYPHMNSIGGDGFWLISEPGRPPVAIQACGPAAGLATRDFYRDHRDGVIPPRGPRAALTVAGAVAGWMKALEYAASWGSSLPVARLLENAIRHGREGIAVSSSQERLTHDKWHELEGFAEFTKIYGGEGHLADKDILLQRDLAATLSRLAEAGLDEFYRGEVARQIASGLEAVGSPLRLEDLQKYQARIVDPLSVELASCTVYNHPPPTQGISSLMILGLFDRILPGPAESFAHIHVLVEAIKRAFLLRNRYVGDAQVMSTDCRSWLEPAFLDDEATKISPEKALSWPYEVESGDTVWMGAADREGRVVSYIQSIFWEFGSGVVVPETGVIWQNRGASFTLTEGPRELAPGRLPFHTLNPALARFPDGRVVAYGTMGGEGQPQTQAAVFSRYAYFGSDIQQAVTAPRWLLGKTWGEDATNLKLESRFDSQVIEQLKKAGHDVEVVGPFEDMMGHAGAVITHRNGLIEGATDPRADGACAGI